MAEAAEEAESIGVAPSRIVALSERSLLAAARGDEARCGGARARGPCSSCEEHGLEGYVRSALAFAVSARQEAHRGNLERARLELELRTVPGPAAYAARCPGTPCRRPSSSPRCTCRILDVAGARAWLAHADEILRRRRPARSPGRAAEPSSAAQVDRVAAAQEGKASTLTAAELRLLPLLTTYLSFREIGEHLFVSRNTVKTQAISVYRKLGVSSRSEAIERAEELGLVERAA